MIWNNSEINWIEKNSGSIENRDLEKLFLSLGEANLQGHEKSRLACGLAFILDLPIRIYARNNLVVRVGILFGGSVRVISEFNVIDSSNLSLVIVKFNSRMKKDYGLSEEIRDFIIDKCWKVGISKK